jgi:hypothetical protein
MGRDRDEARKRHDGEWWCSGRPFVVVPLDVLQSKAFANVSATAKGLFFCLAAQLRIGKQQKGNNGDLTTTRSVLGGYGWKCHKTVARAAKELENAGLIVKTRQGQRRNLATLYAVTFAPLNESPKLEITAKDFPYRAYLLSNPPPDMHPKGQAKHKTLI